MQNPVSRDARDPLSSNSATHKIKIHTLLSSSEVEQIIACSCSFAAILREREREREREDQPGELASD